MAITKAQARQVRQPTLVGDIAITSTLGASNLVEIVEFSSIAEKVTVQSSGDLAGTVEYSANGATFQNSTAFAAGAMMTFSTHLSKVIKVTRTGGSGKLTIIVR